MTLFLKFEASKRLFVLRRSDHAHFVDNVEQEHERMRTMPASVDWAYMQKEMRPIEELCSGEQAIYSCVGRGKGDWPLRRRVS